MIKLGEYYLLMIVCLFFKCYDKSFAKYFNSEVYPLVITMAMKKCNEYMSCKAMTYNTIMVYLDLLD